MVRWSASDPDGDSLSYLLQYSRDAGSTWYTLGSDLHADTFSLDLDLLPGSTQCLVRVIASDGFNTASVQSMAPFAVSKHAPIPTVPSLGNNIFGASQPVILDASAYDPEDGPLSDSAFSWSSDRNGNLGTGRMVSIDSSTLASGYHSVALTVKDSDGQIGNATTGFYVTGGSVPAAIDDSKFYVAQHYLDFLNRRPDPSGLNFWVGQTNNCGSPDLLVCRINVSAAYFLSIEFQQTGYLTYKAYKAAFGNITGKPIPIRRDEMLADMQQIGSGVVVGQGNWQQQLEQNKAAYFDSLVTTDRFATLYPQSMTPEQYIDTLNSNAGGALSQAERNALVNDLKGGAKTSAQVLRSVAEDSDLDRAEFNKAFVLMQYFGYLRRDPDAAPDTDFSGFNFWLAKLNEFNGNYINAEMVKAFIGSAEYRQRFGSN
jgi:hypothetical protein